VTSSAGVARLHERIADRSSGIVHVTPESAKWNYTGLKVIRLAPGEWLDVPTGQDEMLVLPLEGTCDVSVDGKQFTIEGRRSVFDGATDFIYAPVESWIELSCEGGGLFAFPSARAKHRYPVQYFPKSGVAVELRGAGSATRQLNNFFAPGVGDAERLVAVEVITPEGNTSSYPPHKHDRRVENGEAELEEIYYFKFARPGAFGLHRTYSAEGDFDVSTAVVDNDVFLVPRGYHGPCAAMPGYDMYYLNVLAGPLPERSLAFSDDPAHAWVRPSWKEQAADPRLPLKRSQ
jgi:5-deoxy-glucuronate isomerase